MLKSFLPILLILLAVNLPGCSGNKKQSEGGTTGTPQQATAGEQAKSKETTAAPGQSGQNVPGPGTRDIEEMLQAALNGNLQTIENAIENGFDVESTDEQMHTLLMMAAYNGHSKIVEMLLDKGATVDHRDIMKRTALMYASTGPFNETVSLLLDAGADPNLVDGEEHFTPLMFAAAEGQAEVVKTLLKNGADKTMVDVDGESAYDFALNNGHSEVVKILK